LVHASGPLHLCVPFSGIFFPQRYTCLHPCLLQALTQYHHVEPSMTFSLESQSSPLSNHLLPCFMFLYMTYSLEFHILYLYFLFIVCFLQVQCKLHEGQDFCLLPYSQTSE
jgi:hypothetical protein